MNYPPKLGMACGRLGYHHPHCPESDDYDDGKVKHETLADRIATIRLFEGKEQDCFDAYKEEREWDQRTSTPPE